MKKTSEMEREEEDIDLIERHIKGELSEAESRAFDDRITRDLKFAEKVDDYVVIIRGLQDGDSLALSEDVEAWESELRKDATTAPVVALNPWKKWAIAAAVSAVLIATFIFINRPGQIDQQELYLSYFVPYEDLHSVRESDGGDLFQQAMERYNRKAYSEAIPKFLAYLDRNPEGDEARFYLGISYLADKKASNAISVFKQLENEGGIYSDHVSWYLALADILRGDIDSASNRLKTIAAKPAHDFSEEAGQLLNELQ